MLSAMRSRISPLTFVTAIVFAALAQGLALAEEHWPTETQVTFFSPAVPPGPTKEGSCWTRSIAADRPGAWRCMIGNEIYDPCFQVPPLEKEVVCDANPVLGKSGFVMKLTKPFPESKAPPAAWPSPWIMQLADGSVCEPFTGTRPAINGEPATWSCIKPGVEPSPRTNSLVTKVPPGKVWTVDRFAESAAMMGNPATAHKRVEAQVSPVLRVWE